MNRPAVNPEWLNYHHLHRFWIIAKSATMAEAAAALRVSQSTLSMQLRELEGWLGQPLFERAGRRLRLNAAGYVAYEHAEAIFHSGGELMDFFRQRTQAKVKTIRIGAVANLSKNLQFDLLKTLLRRPDVRAVVETGAHSELIDRLADHRLDLVLSNSPEPGDRLPHMNSHSLGSMPVFLTGTFEGSLQNGAFPMCLEGVPLFLPTRQSQVRVDFDRMVDAAGFTPEVRAEVDDMALLRLLALSGMGLALVPAIVVEHELNRGVLKHVLPMSGLHKQFYAVTLRRRVPNGWIDEVLACFRKELKSTVWSLRRAGGAGEVSAGVRGKPEPRRAS
jgi:LysR family transcriptional activator of nhaA